MSAETLIATALHDDALASYPELRDRVTDVAKATIALRGATDLLDVIRLADAYSLAAWALVEAAKRVHEMADGALLAALNEAGAPAMIVNGHTLGTRTNAPGVEITDPAAVPAEFMSVPKPCPDRAKIRSHLKEHPDTNWATLREPTQSLTRRTS